MAREDEEPMKEPAEGEPRGPSAEKDRREDALRLLVRAREHLISQMAEEIVSNRDAILGDPMQTGLFGFEFQEIEDRYIGRLNAINSILDNLEHRSGRIINRTEVLLTSRKKVKSDLDELVARYDQWDVVSVNATKVSEDQLLVIVAFTAEEYPSEAGSDEEQGGGDR